MPNNTDLNEPTVIINQPPPPFYKRRLLIFLTGIGLLLITFIALSKYIPQLPFLSVKEQILSQVGDKKITHKDLDREIKLTWGVYAEKEMAKKDSRDTTLNNLIEKEIITKEAPKLGISVSSEEIQKKLDEAIKQASTEAQFQAILDGNGWTLDDQKEKIKDEILREKLTEKVIAWRKIDGVSAYLNPLSKVYPTQKEIVIAALSKAAESLANGSSPSAAVAEAVKNQSVIKNFGKTESVRVEKISDWDKKILDGIFKLQKGQVSDVLISKSGGSFWVVRINDASDADFNSLKEWLEAKKKEYVK